MFSQGYKRTKALLAVGCSVAVLVATVRYSGAYSIPVIDVANLAQSVIEVFYAAEDYILQGEQIANQVLELENWALDLTQLRFPILDKLYAVVERAFEILDNAKGLAYKASHIDAKFEVLYPAFGGAPMTGEAFVAQQSQWTLQVREANQQAMQSQSIADALHEDQGNLAEVLSRSDSTAGTM